ncbi:hypothetical protein KP509_02G032600 [Ceratopteris richardii]|uniref:PPM-type phosphatase domain-containing protein n=1 Tax=Ceratopteris richardii TaxID=49495 RepID=A0A8T2VCA4_CERRI|nr:hypothetical protein KP509_02G032600 [Ceratopteris richardii]KAH7443394.1 hypothetical protein KP509_02G032600 [Ceratopteris richardii]KAH7443395.1 hypothetical protein KP509_02G032600 [Ceratopteris richardii]
MLDCIGVEMTPVRNAWRKIIMRLLFKLGSWSLVQPAIRIELSGDLSSPDSGLDDGVDKVNSKQSSGNSGTKRVVYVLKSSEGERNPSTWKKTSVSADDSTSALERFASNGGNTDFSLFTKQGLKWVNQDAMILLKNFAGQEDVVFCGVFDGHGADGHRVARNVRDVLPKQLAAFWKSQEKAVKESMFSSDDSENESHDHKERDTVGDPSVIMTWKESIIAAYRITDRELLITDSVDSFSSGTTAVTLVKQGNDLIIGNVGDSRAVLGTRAADNTLLAVQLTVDLKPNIPREADRIRRRRGRVFPIRREPHVHRVWLPDQMSPGLAMSRALGDYCLKNHGVIAEPEVTYRRLTTNDEFVVLATDGVWDVLSNEQVVEIVQSTSDRSQVARVIVEKAVNVWHRKNAASKVDDCAAICLFL